MSEMLSHYYAAAEAAKDLPEGSSLKRAIDAYPQAYILGSEGPDFFFYDVFPKPGHHLHFKYGSLLHANQVDRFFSIGFKTIGYLMTPAERQILFSYLAGFSVHHALDSTAHPFIYFNTGQYRHNKETRIFSYLHKYYEVLLDTALLQVRYHVLASDFDHASLFTVNNRIADTLQKSYSLIFQAVYDLAIEPHQIKDALWGAQHIMRHISDPYGKKTKWLRPIERLFGEELALTRALYPAYTDEPVVLNLLHEPWQHPVTGEVRTDSYLDLFDHAVDLSKEYFKTIETFYEKPETATPEAVDALFGDRSYLTGLPLAEDQTMRYFDQFFLKHKELLKVQ